MDAATREKEARRVTRQIGQLLRLGLELGDDASKGLRPRRVEGQGWTATLYSGDGQPGAEILQIVVRIGERNQERFGA